MADIERAMISKIIDDEDVSTASKAGIRLAWFDDLDNKAAYRWILQHRERYGTAPTRDAFRHEFPTYKLLTVREPYDYYVDKFCLKRKRSIVVDTVTSIDEHLKEDDVTGALNSMSQGLLQVGKEVNVLNDSRVNKRTRSRYARYEYLRDHRGELSGIPTGFGKFDFISGGYHPEQFVLFGGGPKQCKSFMLMHSAMTAQDAGRSVLFVTFEMSCREQEARYDAISAGIDAGHVLRGTLDDEEMKKLKKGMALRKNLPEFIIAADIAATTSVTDLAAKIEEYRPDIVFVDGCYLMDNDIGAEPQTTRSFTAISRGLKRLAQRSKIPVVGTLQALEAKMGKDKAVTMYSLGWTSAWSQDADAIMGVEKLVEKTTLVRIRCVAGRNHASFETQMNCLWDESYFEELEWSDRNEDYEEEEDDD